MRKVKRSSISVPKSSVVLHLAPILMARNIKTPFSYLIKIGINPTSANKMLKGQSVQLNYDQLTKLCLNLNCTPNDLFALRDLELPTNHQLHQVQTIDETVVNPSAYFEGKSLEEIKKILTNDK